MTHFLNRSVSIIAVGAILAGCSSMDKLTGIDPDMVNNKTWVLTSINDHPVVAGSRVTMEIQPSMPDQGRISGQGPCNKYFGGYRIASNKISFTPLGATKMTCPMPIMKQETMFLKAFPNLDKIEFKPSELILKSSKEKDILHFASESAKVRGQIKASSGILPAGSEVIIKLQEAGMDEGSAGVLGVKRTKLGRDVEGAFDYTVNYAPQLVKPGKHYEINVQVLHRGSLVFTTNMKPPVPLKPMPPMPIKK